MNLEKMDLLEFESKLANNLQAVLKFKSHALYFPAEELPDALWLPDESRLLLPLWLEDQFYGVLLAHEPQVLLLQKDIDLSILRPLGSLALENLRLYKSQRLDRNTGLHTTEILLNELSDSITRMQESFAQEFTSASGGGGFGLVLIKFKGLNKLARRYGYVFAANFRQKLAQTLRTVIADDFFAAKHSDTEFALIIPAGGRQASGLASVLQQALEQVRQADPFTGTLLGVQVQIGHALYPQDMDGSRKKGSLEQAASLLHYAQLAAHLAKQQPLAYGRILFNGGQITEILPLSRVRTDLSSQFGARTGQRFRVWQGNHYKGELVLLDVQENESIAEVLHLGDPTLNLEVGDSLELFLAPKANSEEVTTSSLLLAHANLNQPPKVIDPETGLLSHGDFLASLGTVIPETQVFTLALLHITLPENYSEQLKSILVKLTTTWTATFGTNLLGGRFGLNSLIFFHNQQSSSELLAIYSELSQKLQTKDPELSKIKLAVGLASWPCLEYQPADMLAGAQKALEYALLLPFPYVGQLDSLALNISADKLHCQDDIFGAINEYKLALLLDENNSLAWNSLGICLASLGKLPEARHHFTKALDLMPNDATLAYNLATVCQSLPDRKAAKHYFELCLSLNPKHLYALTRLGQLYEHEGDLETARTYFVSASHLHPDSALPHRHLATLAMRQHQEQEARTQLQHALQRNARDPMALTLLSRLYLNSGEDPQVAKLLARQAVAIQPDLRAAWIELARALEAQGQEDLAREARLKAI